MTLTQNQNFGSTQINNTRGNELIDFIVQKNLIPLNDSNLPTFLTSYDQSHIDLILTNFQTSEIIKEWKIYYRRNRKKMRSQNEKYITFTLIYTEDQLNWAQNQQISNTSINFKNSNYVLNQLNKKYATKKPNWEAFGESIGPKFENLEKDIEIISGFEDIEKVTLEMKKIIATTCDENIPQVRNFKKSVSWWTTEIGEKRLKVNRLRRQYQRTTDAVLRDCRRTAY